MVTYDIRDGIKKIKTKTMLTMSALGLGTAGLAMAVAMPFATNAAVERVPGDWQINSGSSLVFSCSGAPYEHTFNSIVNQLDGNFTGTGFYVPDQNYKWDVEGNITGSILNATITYTGTAASSVYHLINGVISSDGSVFGSSDSNCQLFTMPPGSLTQFSGNHGQYVTSQSNKMLAAQSRIGMPIQSKKPVGKQGNNLSCFAGTSDGGFNGTCTLSKNSKSAILDTNDGDGNPNNNYAGVYYANSTINGKTLGAVTKLSFSYNGSDAVGGSPRLSIPIDVDGNGTNDGFAFVDTLGCNDGNPNTGTLDVINDTTCTITFGSNSYVNWTDFVSNNPTYKIATDTVTFVIVDQPGHFEITNVQIA